MTQAAGTTTLCEVRVEVTGGQRKALLAACQRLGLDWPGAIARVRASCQDAAVRKITELCGGPRDAMGRTRFAPSPALVAWFCSCGLRVPAAVECCEVCGMHWEQSTVWEVVPVRTQGE